MTASAGPAIPQSAVDVGLPAGGWGSARAMNALEALMWRLEADPRLRSPIATLDVLDRAPDWDRLTDAHDWATRLVPRFRCRVVEPPGGLGTPLWAVDPDFALARHLHRVRVPEPGGLPELLAVCEAEMMQPFAAGRPPWTAMLVEGLPGDQAAYFLKLHHSITDGLGGVQLLSLLHSRRRAHTPDKPAPEPPSGERLGPLGALAEGAWRDTRGAAHRARQAIGTGARAARHPLAAATESIDLARSVGRTLNPPAVEPSPLLRARGGPWRFGALEVALNDLKAAAKAAGGSLNDAYVAALLGGFARYHDRHGVALESLSMAMPVSVRAGADPMGGNRFTGARFGGPAGIADPADRVQAVRQIVLDVREDLDLDVIGALAPALARLPAPLLARWYGSQSTRIDLQASNVPGIPVPVYLAGAQILRAFPYGPLPGCGVMVALVSHAGTCCIGLNIDSAAITAPDVFMDCVQEGFDEVLALAPGAPRVARPLGGDP